MTTEPAYSRYEALLKRLHDLNVRGELDSPEADLVREDMEEPWSRLSDDDKAQLAGLSSDLYSFSDEEIVRDSDIEKPVLVERARDAFKHGNWPGLLEALRYTHQYFPAEMVAYMRGRCWQQLGRPEAALWFFERAHQLSPSDRTIAFLRLEALFRAGHRQQALDEAHQILSQRDAPIPLIFGAAKVCADVAPELPTDEGRRLDELVAAAVSGALSAIDRNEAIAATMPQSLVLAGRLHLAVALERLGKLEEAARAYDGAIARHPSSDELLMARALFLLRTDHHTAAQRDLEELIGRRTHLVSAYLFRAHHLLMHKDYARCLELSDRGLRLSSRPDTRVVFLEWIAISLYELQASDDEVRSSLEEAMSIDPMNDDVRRNLEALAQVPTARRASLTSRIVPDPSDALRDLRDRLQPTA